MAKWTEGDIPDLTGKVALVTGANSGLGFNTTRALAAHGAQVIMACRTREKAERAADEMRAQQADARLDIRSLDLSDLDSVSDLAQALTAEHVALDLLINNAGVMAVPYAKTRNGFEMQMGTNHLGHFALTGQLLECIKPGGRIVSVASLAHRWTPGIHFDDLHWDQRRYKRWQAYSDSKLANLLFMHELARRIKSSGKAITVAAAHPGFSDTHLQYVAAEQKNSSVEKWTMMLGNSLFAQSASMGALPSLYAATASDVQNSDYIGPGGFQQMRGYPRKVGCRQLARSAPDATRLWALSEQLTGVSYLAG